MEPTWSDEVSRGYVDDEEGANGPNRSFCEDAGSENIDPTCGCLFVSGIVCGKLGFKRLGNMVILKERMVDVETTNSFHSLDNELETDIGGSVLRQEPEIVYIVGPYWVSLTEWRSN